MPSLLAVDLGLRTGLALYGDDGRLRWVRSSNTGSRARLKKAAAALLREPGDVAWLVLEGGGELAEVWRKEAERMGVGVHVISAEVWRRDLLLAREQRSGEVAKQKADRLARAVIEWSGVRGLTSLRHDAAEAVLVGLWGVRRVGWLDELPPDLARR
jgi:hypothetical protein